MNPSIEYMAIFAYDVCDMFDDNTYDDFVAYFDDRARDLGKKYNCVYSRYSNIVLIHKDNAREYDPFAPYEIDRFQTD